MADRPDENLAGLRELLEARCHVHTCADAHLMARAFDGAEVDNCLARLDSDSHPESDPILLVALRPPDAAPGSSQGALGVVRVRNGRTEEGVNGIADVLFASSPKARSRARLRRSGPSATVRTVEPTTSTKSAVTTRRSTRVSAMGSVRHRRSLSLSLAVRPVVGRGEAADHHRLV